MLRSIQNHLLQPAHRLRLYSQAVSPKAPVASASKPPARAPAATVLRHPYFVPRNTLGSIPVYTDIRNQNRYLTLIRNVEGDVQHLARDLKQTLFQPDSPEAAKIKIDTVKNRHVVLSGGHFKDQVVQWLKAKGF